MKKHWKLALLGSVLYLLFLVILTPASWWLRLVSLPAELQHGPVSGTLWQGEVQGVAFQQMPLPAISWQLNPWALLTLTADLKLQSGNLQQAGQPYFHARVKAGLGKIAVQDSILKLPVASLVPSLQLPLPVQAAGELLVDIKQLHLTQQHCLSLQGQASWLDASLQPPTGTWLDLKQLHATLSCEDGQPVLITDPDNPLSLAVTATVSSAGSLRVQGSLKPDASLPTEVHQAMQFVGQPDANGRYSLNF